MPNIRSIDMPLVDDLFEMGSGYVLDFSDRTMALYFAEELNVDIFDRAYQDLGTSKAKRLRCYLNKVDAATAIKTLTSLWEYREATRRHRDREEWVPNAEGRFLSLLNRMQGKPDQEGALAEPPKAAFDRPKLHALKQRLLDFATLEPQRRGYAFETWLTDAFNFFGLAAREPFRNRGEQIDGSFQLRGETYLVEAKWRAAPTDAADLHSFHGKLDQKAAWTRGLFISNSGFTTDGLAAFGKGKRLICMDGLDLFEMLDREIPLDQVLERKVRRAAESGQPFERVRDLFPR
mgnify:CR=1 FL=1